MLVTGLLISLANSLAERADELTVAEGSGSGFGAGANCAEDRVAEAFIESASFGTDCADADVAQAITITKAKAVVHIFLVNKLPMPAAGPARARGPEKWSEMVVHLPVFRFFARSSP